ncbi:RNA-guided endonuclease InsQ/TnpB family protein [Halomarina litorea]|uniref:RNA-guided endonuclease InsQ/TnpB family protein n=1 Tax=Halomarina litorea TaxID=2961595 RepID=UPI0020C556D9|nr:transposase [Halomarina sp. BCD28]
MANLTVTRTYVGSIQNQRQVHDGLDSLGDSASKLWNVARWTVARVWGEIGIIPDESALKSYMKNQACWKDLNAQSSQKVIEELSDAFQSWFDLRQKDDKANPPGYRKHGDERPRSTVTFKADGFKHDPENNRVRLSKGSNLKEHFSDFLLCEYQTRSNVDLSEVNSIQNVRAVWNGDEWELHFVCKISLEVDESAGNGVAGIDLGITNIVTVAFPEEYVLYPGNSLKQDKHYFTRAEYNTEGENGPSEQSMWARRKLADRETHFYHVLSETIISECVERSVGTLAVSWPENVRESDWGKTGNKKLHTWAFDRLYQYLAYKGEEHGVEVLKENEWNTSKTCSACGDDTKSNRKHRGLYVCQSCGLVGNADCNGAENMRQKITSSPHGEDRSNGCVAQPSTYLFDRESGTFHTREQVVS